jgi:hypothetical protein
MFDPNQPYDILSVPETGSLPPEPPPPPLPVPVTYYSTGAAAGGPDESQDRWTNAGYTSTGRNLTPGIAAVNESVYPLGTIFRDGDTGDVFIAADRHGNSDASVVDIYKSPDSYQPRKENRNLSVVGQLEKVPSTIDGINAALAQYRSATPAASTSPGFDPSQPFEVLSYGPTSHEDPAPPPTGSSPFHQPERRFTPEQYEAFSALSGLDPFAPTRRFLSSANPETPGLASPFDPEKPAPSNPLVGPHADNSSNYHSSPLREPWEQETPPPSHPNSGAQSARSEPAPLPPSPPPEHPRDLGFLNKMKRRWDAGREQAADDQLAYRAMMGEIPWESVRERLEPSQSLDDAKGKAWYSEGLLSAVEMVPAIIDSAASGVGHGLATGGGFAGTVALAGQVGPQIAAPEELITVPAGAVMGYSVGQAYGTSTYWYKQGAGSLYHDLRKEGIPHRTAQTVSAAFGIPYAAIEAAKVGKFIPGLKKTAAQSIAAPLKRRLLELAKEKGADYVDNIGQETGQELLQIGAESLAGWISSIEPPKDKAAPLARILATVQQTAAAAPFLMAPKAAVDARYAIRDPGGKSQTSENATGAPNPRGTNFEERVNLAADRIENQVEFPNGKSERIIPGPSPDSQDTGAIPPQPTTTPDARFAKRPGLHAELGQLWQDLAQDGKTTVLGKTPYENDFPSIIKELAGPAAKNISVKEQRLPNGETWGYTLTDPSGHIDVSINGDLVEENSEFAGDHSTSMYQAMFAWAHNNGKTVTEDVVLSHLAVLRRTSQMLSSALRYGTTRHMLPGPNSGVEGWRTDNTPDSTRHNIGLLAAREAELVTERLPALKNLRYDLANQAFYEGNTRIPDAGIREDFLTRITALDPDFAQGVGDRTLRRALATLAAQAALESGQSVQLVGNAADAPPALQQVRYSQSLFRLGPPTERNRVPKLEAIRAELLGKNRPTPQSAIDWMRMFKAIAPGPARQLDLQILSRLEASRKMAAIEASLTGRSVVHGVPPDAHAAIHRDTIYLFQEALGEYRRNGNELTEGIRRVQHEVCHKWWDALSQNERAALTRLWRAEISMRTGPLFDAEGRLRPEVMAGVETDVQEWFAERAALANDAWAQKRASIAAHDGTLVGRAAARLRGWLFEARQTIAPSLSHDVIANELRNVLRRGMGKTEPSPSAFARRRYSPNSQDVRSDTAQREINANLQALQTDRETILKEIAAATVQGYSTDDLQVFQDWLIQLDQKIQELSPTKDTKSPQKEHELPQVGKSFNSQRHKIPKAGGNIVPILLRAPSEKWVDRVTDWLDAIKKVEDPNGHTVLLANPEDGSLRNRALHLVGSYRADDVYKRGKRELSSDKARTVFAITTTIEDYQVLAEDENLGLAYFRRYSDGTLHMVIVEAASGKLRDHALITHRQIGKKDGAEGFTILHVRHAKK